MRLLYATDLHGHIQKYEDVIAYAIKHDIDIIHLGADLLPGGPHMQKEQKKFIKGYLKNFYDRCERHGIFVLAFFGNDDIYTRKKYFKQCCGSLLDESPFQRNGYLFKAYGYVPDHPYPLKNGCKYDDENSEPSVLFKTRVREVPYKDEIVKIRYAGDPIDFDEDGCRYVIKDMAEYLKAKGTIKNDLKKIRTGKKTIMAIHAPPSQVNLDVCNGYRRVGSDSVLHWIEKRQPLLVLCGHIHESGGNGYWKTYIGKTLVIQPGQADEQTTMVDIEIFSNRIESEIVMGVKLD